MNFLASLTNLLTKSQASTRAPENHCPNCWGTQEYEGAFLEAAQNEKIDLNNIEQRAGWIQAYAARYFEGIQLHKISEMLECPSYKLTYRLI